jgi:hypothetical protein
MHIIDRGKHIPQRRRFALGRSFEINGETVVLIEIEYPSWHHLELCESEKESDIIELNKNEN